VKYSCLFVTQLAKPLEEPFDTAAESLMPVLFQRTTHGTQIIAKSCHHSVIAIVQHCHSRRLIAPILAERTSKAAVLRSIVSECIETIVSQ
jgi:hypothetical protein